MKNRRLAIIAFVLVAVMAIGVGYATLNDTLTASGTVAADQTTDSFDRNVVFVKAEGNDGAVITHSLTGTGNDTSDGITITIDASNFSAFNDSVTVTVTVQNKNDIAAYIESVDVAALTDADAENTLEDNLYFDISCTAAEDDEIPEYTSGNGLYTFDITFTLNQTPVEVVTAGFSIQLKLTTDAP